MKNLIAIKYLAAGLLGALLVFSCNENQPSGDEFSWSPDGKRLALVNVESNELLAVEFESNWIKRVILIDSLSGEQAQFHQPSWSPDGNFLLYAKSSKTALEIFTYALAEKQWHPIDSFSVDEKAGGYAKFFLQWLPTQNRLLWSSWRSAAEYRLFSARADGTDRRLLLNLAGGKPVAGPACSPDGNWIAYATYGPEGHRNNGLWKMKRDGSRHHQIYPANEIAAVEWRPDGLRLAVVTKIISKQTRQQSGATETQYQFQLSLIDPDGQNEKVLLKTEKQILALDWSPHGHQLAFLQQDNSGSDVWMVNMDSNEKIKLNFGKVQRFFGWNNSQHCFYTTDYPQNLITETKEQKDARELLETLRGQQQENLLVCIEPSRRRNLNDNIFAIAAGGQNQAMALYRSFKPNFTESEIYCPVVQFADGRRIYLARTKSQNLAAADECCLSHDYKAALDHLSRYWEVDVESPDFQEQLDVTKIIGKLENEPDSSSLKRGLEALEDGALLRTVLTLRKLNHSAKADWLWHQLQKLTCFFIASSNEHKKDLLNEIFWSFINTYSQANELETGIRDMDQLLRYANQDSSLIAFSNHVQAMLAIQARQPELSLKKMSTAIQWLPANMAEPGDIGEMIGLCHAYLRQDQTAMLIPVLNETIRRFPDNKNLFRIYDRLGDAYRQQGDRDKAIAAYQQAVWLNFDDNEIWDKIFEMR